MVDLRHPETSDWTISELENRTLMYSIKSAEGTFSCYVLLFWAEVSSVDVRSRKHFLLRNRWFGFVLDTEASSTFGKSVLEPYKPFSLAVVRNHRITVMTEYVSFPRITESFYCWLAVVSFSVVSHFQCDQTIFFLRGGKRWLIS